MTDNARPEREWNEVVRRNWGERAPDWDVRGERNRHAPDRASDIGRTMAALRIGAGSKLLDAGCGTGQYAIAFAEHGCDVLGIDITPEMIERAQVHAQETGRKVDFLQGDITSIPAPFATFDAIHARVALQFVPNVPKVLLEFRRVLRPGGRLYTSVPGALSPIYGRAWERHLNPSTPTGVNYLTPWELEELLERHGWRVIDGWGEFGASGTGQENLVNANFASNLPKRLQQASATTWAVISE